MEQCIHDINPPPLRGCLQRRLRFVLPIFISVVASCVQCSRPYLVSNICICLVLSRELCNFHMPILRCQFGCCYWLLSTRTSAPCRSSNFTTSRCPRCDVVACRVQVLLLTKRCRNGIGKVEHVDTCALYQEFSILQMAVDR